MWSGACARRHERDDVATPAPTRQGSRQQPARRERARTGNSKVRSIMTASMKGFAEAWLAIPDPRCRSDRQVGRCRISGSQRIAVILLRHRRSCRRMTPSISPRLSTVTTPGWTARSRPEGKAPSIAWLGANHVEYMTSPDLANLRRTRYRRPSLSRRCRSPSMTTSCFATELQRSDGQHANPARRERRRQVRRAQTHSRITSAGFGHDSRQWSAD